MALVSSLPLACVVEEFVRVRCDDFAPRDLCQFRAVEIVRAFVFFFEVDAVVEDFLELIDAICGD